MSKRLRTRLLKYGITSAVYLAFVLLYCNAKDFAILETVEKYRVLCDAFTVPGLMSILSGLLGVISNEGAFEGIGYAMRLAVRAMLPGGRYKSEKYSDYVEERRGKKITGFGFLFICGGIAMAIALVFLMLFYRHF